MSPERAQTIVSEQLKAQGFREQKCEPSPVTRDNILPPVCFVSASNSIANFWVDALADGTAPNVKVPIIIIYTHGTIDNRPDRLAFARAVQHTFVNTRARQLSRHSQQMMLKIKKQHPKNHEPRITTLNNFSPCHTVLSLFDGKFTLSLLTPLTSPKHAQASLED